MSERETGSREPVVGAGVRAALARRGDQAAGDEVYLNERWSLTAGEEYAYLYSAERDQVYVIPKG